MKKTLSLLLCIILISCLVSCDISAIWNSIKGTTESTTTTTTAPPVYETVTLGELINKEDVAYIKHGYTYFLSSSINYLSTTTDIDMFFDEYINANFKLEFVSSQYELYDINMQEAWTYVRQGKEYVEWHFYNDNQKNIGTITIYPNNMIGFVSHEKQIYVMSVTIANLDVKDIIDRLYTGE